MNTIRLTAAEGGNLHLADTVLVCLHSEGDCDTIPWPMVCDFRTEQVLRSQLAAALYDECEAGRLPEDATVELPDGTVFCYRTPGAAVATGTIIAAAPAQLPQDLFPVAPAAVDTFNVKGFAWARCGANGSGRATVKVQGYWSGDSATAYLERRTDWSSADPEGVSTWSISISHSSGGRDTGEVASDATAAMNFGIALCALAEYAEKALAPQRVAELERLYQVQRAADRAERDAAAAAKAARIAADPALGTAAAKATVALAIANAHATDTDVLIHVYERGSDVQMDAIVKLTRAGLVRCTSKGYGVTRAQLVDLLAASSRRSAVAPVIAA